MVKGHKSKACVIMKQNFKNFDEQAFLHDLFYADLDKICLIPDPELAFNQFFHVSNSLTEKHAPYKRFRIEDHFNPWFFTELSEAIHAKGLAWSKARLTDNHTDWLHFW